MLMQLTIDSEILSFELPPAVQSRLQELLDRQDQGFELSAEERGEAEGLVKLSEFLTLLRLHAKTVSQSLKQDTPSLTESTEAKPFEVRTFSLGQDVSVDREQLYRPTMTFAGCWEDLPEDIIQDIENRRSRS